MAGLQRFMTARNSIVLGDMTSVWLTELAVVTAAGVIHGFVSGMDFKKALEFGVAASQHLNEAIYGDFNQVGVKVETLMSGDASGRGAKDR